MRVNKNYGTYFDKDIKCPDAPHLMKYERLHPKDMMKLNYQ